MGREQEGRWRQRYSIIAIENGSKRSTRLGETEDGRGLPCLVLAHDAFYGTYTVKHGQGRHQEYEAGFKCAVSHGGALKGPDVCGRKPRQKGVR